MPRKVRITAGAVQMDAQLNDTETAKAVWDALPITAPAGTWGDEIYFGIPVEAELEAGQEVVEMGDLGYWPPGNAFCIFFGRTPASRGDEIRPASAVTVIGKIEGDPTAFKQVKPGTAVAIERAV
jgi:hypothetical protein